MPILTLTPHRCGSPTGFAQSSYAYCHADRPVRVNGVLITPSTLYDSASEDGRLDFDIPSSDLADDGLPFSYTVAAFDPTSRRLWIHNIVMPAEATELYDLVPEVFNLDDPEFVPTVCAIPSCGLDPRVITATIEFDFSTERGYLMLRHPSESDQIGISERFAMDEEFTVLITESNNPVSSSQMRGTPTFIYPASEVAAYDSSNNANMDDTEGTLLRVSDLTVGNYIRLLFNGEYVVTDYDTTVGVPTQSQIDDFIACVASGGVIEQPILPEPPAPEEEIT